MHKVIIAASLIIVGGITYWFWSQSRPPPAPPPAAPVAQAPPPPPMVPDAGEAKIQHSMERKARRPAKSNLPALDDSDAAMRDGLTELFGAKRLAEFLLMEAVIRRIVATVDSLARESVASDSWPLRPVPGELQVYDAGGLMTLSPQNSTRYESRLRLAETVSVVKLVDLYAQYYPLFQRAYRELGYPKGYFNDRLIEVIDHMLATPESSEPIRLTMPGVRYHFADPDLQGRSAGQKILLRMGPGQSARVKHVLRRLRDEITR
jgi:hypothetical protein